MSVTPPLELRKQLFRSPGLEADRLSETSATLMNKLQIEHDLEMSYRSLQKDLHEQRIKHLRQKLKHLSDDDWRYTSIEKLIGLQ